MFYRLREDIDAIRLADGALLFKSDSISSRVEGGFADLLQRSILPALDGTLTVSDLARRLDVQEEALRGNFEQLVRAGVLEQAESRLSRERSNSQLNLTRALGFDDELVENRFSLARIGVFGLDQPGMAVAEA